MSDTPWTPDQPLRADATDDQMRRRYWFFRDTASRMQDITAIPLAIAREFAAACVAADWERHLPPGYGRCGQCGSEWVTATQHGLFFSHTCPRPTP